MGQKNDKIGYLKETIRRQLKEAGVYDPEISYQIELTASDILLYRKLRDEALAEETDVLITEFSREQRPRQKINPIFDAMKKQADVVRKDLRALYMNRELKRAKKEDEDKKKDDPIAALMNKMNEIDSEDE